MFEIVLFFLHFLLQGRCKEQLTSRFEQERTSLALNDSAYETLENFDGGFMKVKENNNV